MYTKLKAARQELCVQPAAIAPTTCFVAVHARTLLSCKCACLPAFAGAANVTDGLHVCVRDALYFGAKKQ